MFLFNKGITYESFQSTKLSVVLRSDLKPDWNRDIRLLDSKNQVSLLFIILSSVLHRQLVRSIIIRFRRIFPRFGNWDYGR